MSMDVGWGPEKGGEGISFPEGLKPEDAAKPPQPKGLVGLNIRSEVGGSEFVVRSPPTREIDSDCACRCVACVRACEAA